MTERDFEVTTTGFYYFIFANENEITANFIRAHFDMHKTVFDVSPQVWSIYSVEFLSSSYSYKCKRSEKVYVKRTWTCRYRTAPTRVAVSSRWNFGPRTTSFWRSPTLRIRPKKRWSRRKRIPATRKAWSKVTHPTRLVTGMLNILIALENNGENCWIDWH